MELLLSSPLFKPTAFKNMPIQIAAYYGHSNVIQALLKNKQVNPAIKNNSSIMSAAANGHTEAVRVLLRDGRVDASANNNAAIRSAGNELTAMVLLRNRKVFDSLEIDHVALVFHRIDSSQAKALMLLWMSEKVKSVSWLETAILGIVNPSALEGIDPVEVTKSLHSLRHRAKLHDLARAVARQNLSFADTASIVDTILCHNGSAKVKFQTLNWISIHVPGMTWLSHYFNVWLKTGLIDPDLDHLRAAALSSLILGNLFGMVHLIERWSLTMKSLTAMIIDRPKLIDLLPTLLEMALDNN